MILRTVQNKIFPLLRFLRILWSGGHKSTSSASGWVCYILRTAPNDQSNFWNPFLLSFIHD